MAIQLAGGPEAPASAADLTARDRLGRDLGLELRIRGGDLQLQESDAGVILLQTLRVELDDIEIPAGVMHRGPVHLSDLSITLTAPIELPAAGPAGGSEHQLHGRGTADLALNWSITTRSGRTYPFAPQPLRNSELEVLVDDTAQELPAASVHAAFHGRIGRYAERLELADLALQASSAAPVAPAGRRPAPE
jgi:hypothetical protein